jgi:hypothetical protein
MGREVGAGGRHLRPAAKPLRASLRPRSAKFSRRGCVPLYAGAPRRRRRKPILACDGNGSGSGVCACCRQRSIWSARCALRATDRAAPRPAGAGASRPADDPSGSAFARIWRRGPMRPLCRRFSGPAVRAADAKQAEATAGQGQPRLAAMVRLAAMLRSQYPALRQSRRAPLP